MPFFSKVFRSNKDSANKSKPKENGAHKLEAPKPRWDDAWQRTVIEPEEVQELLRGLTQEIKARALDVPFLILPFRPASDPSAAKTFVRNYFGNGLEKNTSLQGEGLLQELRLIEPMVLCSVLKWCWSRLSGGIVTWEAYELFQIGEQDSNEARDAFTTFIPISVGSDARANIIFDFFELLAAMAAHGKANGLAGRKLSRLGGWWAFEHLDTSNGFDSGYKSWSRAADATSHLFFAYLRAMSPDSTQGVSGISTLPRSLQALVASTEYPPVAQQLLQSRTSKVVMVVETVSPTPFALLRRAKNFQYRDDDHVLRQFSDFEDPVDAMTDECRRVLRSISSANDSSSTKMSTSLKDPSWSRFEDVGFGSLGEDDDGDNKPEGKPTLGYGSQQPQVLRTTPMSNNLNRPTTPSWADFLSSGFVDEKQPQPTLLLPPDKVLPPINLDLRGQSSQSHRRMTDDDSMLEPGELANIAVVNLDDAFWWVWITSLAGEEPPARKAVFGRCALIETRINNSWLVIEEIIKGAAPEPEAGAYVAEKKSRFGFSKRNRVSRAKSTKIPTQKTDGIGRSNETPQPSKTSIAPDQRSRIQAAAAALQEKNKRDAQASSPRRGRQANDAETKATSTLTLQPVIVKEAAPAMKWASSYDKNTIRAQYLGNTLAGRGSTIELKDVLEDDGANTRDGATPTPGAEPTQPAAATLAAKKPQQAEQSVPIKNKPQPEIPKQHMAQNGNAASPQAHNFFTSQMPVAPKVPSKEPSPARPPPASTERENQASAQVGQKETAAPTLEAKGEGSAEQYPRPMERSALSPLQQAENKQIPDLSRPPKTPDESNKTAQAGPPSPESPRNKLKKKNTPTGFKGMFSRKKAEEQPKPAEKTKQPSSSSSVAAARAALEAKAKESQASSPPQVKKVTTKRFSTVGGKAPVEEPAPVKAQERAPVQESVSSAPEEAHDQQQHAMPPVQPAAESYARPVSTTETQGSTIDPAEAQRADTEFRAFDQGPLEENPYVMDNGSGRTSTIQDHEGGKGAEPAHVEEETGKANAPPHVEEEGAEPERVPTSEEQAAQTSDRWAQIRKNAADRAARMSEDQSGPTDKTDDGETSGEETIESRVARIKARVAELTGNMDTNAPKA